MTDPVAPIEEDSKTDPAFGTETESHLPSEDSGSPASTSTLLNPGLLPSTALPEAYDLVPSTGTEHVEKLRTFKGVCVMHCPFCTNLWYPNFIVRFACVQCPAMVFFQI